MNERQKKKPKNTLTKRTKQKSASKPVAERVS